MSKISRNKIRDSLQGRQVVDRISVTCPGCDKIFEKTINSNRRFCCKNCVKLYRRKTDSNFSYREYKIKCKFKFSVKDYPDYFDLDLVKKHGFYKAINNGNNLGGVSRDHKISVKFGWENNIDPKIISHPANCELMVHSDNISKYKNCRISLEQLKKDIENWPH